LFLTFFLWFSAHKVCFSREKPWQMPTLLIFIKRQCPAMIEIVVLVISSLTSANKSAKIGSFNLGLLTKDAQVSTVGHQCAGKIARHYPSQSASVQILDLKLSSTTSQPLESHKSVDTAAI
jgi:hypothetical protein